MGSGYTETPGQFEPNLPGKFQHVFGCSVRPSLEDCQVPFPHGLHNSTHLDWFLPTPPISVCRLRPSQKVSLDAYSDVLAQFVWKKGLFSSDQPQGARPRNGLGEVLQEIRKALRANRFRGIPHQTRLRLFPWSLNQRKASRAPLVFLQVRPFLTDLLGMLRRKELDKVAIPKRETILFSQSPIGIQPCKLFRGQCVQTTSLDSDPFHSQVRRSETVTSMDPWFFQRWRLRGQSRGSHGPQSLLPRTVPHSRSELFVFIEQNRLPFKVSTTRTNTVEGSRLRKSPFFPCRHRLPWTRPGDSFQVPPGLRSCSPLH